MIGYSWQCFIYSWTFLNSIFSFVFNHDDWELTDTFQAIIDAQDHSLYGDEIPWELTEDQARVYHYVGMRKPDFWAFCFMFIQNSFDIIIGAHGVFGWGIVWWLFSISWTDDLVKFCEVVNKLLGDL